MATSILLVDDDPVARQTILEIFAAEPRLQDLGADVVQVLDAPRALSHLAADRPDLVLTDLSVQGMDGFAFCSEIRRVTAGHPMGLVVMSWVYKDTGMIGPLLDELRATFAPKPLVGPVVAEAVLSALPPAHKVVPPMGLTSDTLLAVSLATPAPTPAAPVPDESGSLSDRPVASRLFEYIEQRATGTLLLVRGHMRKEIFLRGGRAVAADSNLRQEALGSLLVAKNVIDDPQLEYLLAETKSRGQKMGTVLVELGWMTPEDVLQYLAAQARKRISDCLRWQEGTFAFTRGDTFSSRVMEHELDTPRIIFTGLYRTAVSDELISRFDEDGARPIRLLPRFDPFRAAFEAVFGPQILQPLHEGATLGELVLRDDGRVLALAIETLVTAGLAELGEPRAAGTVHSKVTAEVFTLERLGNQAGGPLHPLGGAADDREVTHQELDVFGPDSSSLELDLGGPGSGKVDLFSRPPSNSDIPAPPRATPADDLRTALLREYLELHGKSHYEVLGLPSSADEVSVARAYAEKSSRFSDDALTGLTQEGDRAKLEALRAAYDRAFKALSDPAARAGYDSAPAPVSSDADHLGAELAFREGVALLERGQATQAIASFEKAVAGRNDQAAYHAYLGWALFQARGLSGARAAKDRLSHALALDPDLAKAHEVLGRVAVKEADWGTARRHLDRALELEPAQPEVLGELIAVFDQVKDYRAAEKSYRRSIASLGEGAPGLRARLWRTLAEVYELRLGQAESARVAYETAARLSPSDVALQRKVVELDGDHPERWRESARALVAEWQQRPTDGSLGERLVDVFTRGNQPDAATLAAAAFLLRGGHSEPLMKLAHQGRPAQFRPLARPLDTELRQRLAFPGEDDEIEKLVGALAGAGIIERVSDVDLGLTDATPVLPDQLPAAFRRMLKYAGDTLGIKEPSRILEVARLENEAKIVDTRPQALVVGPELLRSNDTVELAFRLGRALALSSSGRVAAVARTGRHLRPAFLAAVTLARGASASPEADVDDLMKRIMASSTVHKLKIMDVAGRLLRARRSMDVSRWARSLLRTATRIGLLLSADLLRVGRAVDAEEGAAALDDLIAFALSPEHLELRDELGISASAPR